MLKHYLLSIRPNHLFITIAPIFLYYSFCYFNETILDNRCFLLVALSTVLFHISVNTLADVQDFKKGIDNKNSMGSSGMLVLDLVDPVVVRRIGLCSFGIASLIGVFAALLFEPRLFMIGIPAAFICYSYSEQPFALKYRALGELCVFLIWGPMLALACSFSLIHKVSVPILWLSIMNGILTAIILLSNNLRDFENDKKFGYRTLVVRIGLKYGFALLFILIWGVFILLIANVAFGMLPKISLLALLSYLLVFVAMRHFNQQIFTEFFVWLDLLFSLLIGLGLLAIR